jgi:hypothetical protein
MTDLQYCTYSIFQYRYACLLSPYHSLPLSLLQVCRPYIFKSKRKSITSLVYSQPTYTNLLIQANKPLTMCPLFSAHTLFVPKHCILHIMGQSMGYDRLGNIDGKYHQNIPVIRSTSHSPTTFEVVWYSRRFLLHTVL